MKTGYINVGKIGSTYGIHGWLKIRSYTEFEASILDFTPWYLTTDDQTWHTVEVEDSRIQGKTVLVKLTGIQTPEEARLLTGKTIAIKRSQLPALKKNEFYWSDLIGLTVINQTGIVLGKVTYLIATGSNDVLVVKGEKEQAIPYLTNVVSKVDLGQQEIHVVWDE